MLVCVYQQVSEQEVPHGKVIMAGTVMFGYMVLWRSGQRWGIEFLQNGIYPEASRRAWEMNEGGECDYAKAMHYHLQSFPYEVVKALRFGEHPYSLQEVVDFLIEYDLGEFSRADIRKHEVQMRTAMTKPAVDISSVGFW